MPGTVGLVLLAIGFGGALAASAVRMGRPSGLSKRQVSGTLAEIPHRAVLVVLLALASLVGEVLYTLVTGTHVFSARGMIASWPALAVLVAAIIVAAGPRLGPAAAILAFAGSAIGAAETLQPKYQRPNWPAVADFINANARPGDVVVDAAAFTAVPLTPLDVFLTPRYHEFRLLVPSSAHPTGRVLSTGTFDGTYSFTNPVPPPRQLMQQGFAAARGHRMLIVLEPNPCPAPITTLLAAAVERHLGRPFGPSWPNIPAADAPQAWCPHFGKPLSPTVRGIWLNYLGSYKLPAGFGVTKTRSFPGVTPLMVVMIKTK